ESCTTTCFDGTFGTSEVGEIAYHATQATAQNLESASWGTNADPDIGDPIVWLSKLWLYDSSGNLVAQGPGYSDPSVGGGGDNTWYDDYLTTTITQAGTYTIEVGSWLLTSGLPVGVDYDLQVSVQNHPTAGFVFNPTPVHEDENGNNSTSTPQNVDDANDWYTFFNQTIGDTDFGGSPGTNPDYNPDFNGSINSSTPYVQISGSGDGTYDVYSFTVTPDMLN